LTVFSLGHGFSSPGEARAIACSQLENEPEEKNGQALL